MGAAAARGPRLDILGFANILSLMPRPAGSESAFHAIASPTRRALLDALVLGESNVSELVTSLDVTQSAVSQQLAILKTPASSRSGPTDDSVTIASVAEPLAEIDALARARIASSSDGSSTPSAPCSTPCPTSRGRSARSSTKQETRTP